MNLSSFAVRRGVTFAMLFAMIFGFGLFSLARLQLDLFPDISFPQVMVITTYTGASPEDIETLLSRPLEGAAATVKDVKELRSTSKQGVSLVEIAFDWGKDMEQAETDVRRAIEMVAGFLPDDADAPMIFAFDPSMQPILMFMLTGPYPLDELRRIADNEVEPRIARLPGVALAQAEGGLEREIHVVLDPAKITAFGLDVNQLLGTIYRENVQMPGGSIEQGSMDFTIQTRGKYQSVAEIGEVVVGIRQNGRGPTPIRLKEVAAIEDSYYETQRILEVDSRPGVWMFVRKQSGANTVRACDTVMAALPEIKRELAAEVDFQIIFNQADFINQALGNLSTTALAGVVIAFFVLLFFLRNVASALIVALAMPVSVVTTFAIMDQANMTLNVISMAGLALAVGMLVDNAIVVLENIYRLRQEGATPWTAAIDGAKSVGLAVTASTLTTIAVFVPVLFVPGIAGVLFRDMAVTICFSLAVSLFVALTLIPLAASRLLGWRHREAQAAPAARHDPLAGLRHRYDAALGWVLGRRWVVGASVGALLAVTAVLSVFLPTDFLREDDNSFLFVSAEAPVGTSLSGSAAIMREVEQVIAATVSDAERRLIASDVGVGKGFTAIFAKGVHSAIFRVPLVGVRDRDRSKAELQDAVREALHDVAGLKYKVAEPFNMMGGEGDIEILLRGYDLATSRAIGLELEEKLRQLPEMADVTFSMEDQKPEVRVRYDRPKMAQLGLSAAAVSNAISAYFQGTMAGRYAEGGDEFDILVRYGKEHRTDIDELRRMPIATPLGLSVPLANVADVSVGLGPVDIARLDQERVTKVACYLKQTYLDADNDEQKKDLKSAIGRVQEVLDAYPWPKDFTGTIGGSAEDFIKSFQYLILALLVSVLLVYMVMASQFESFRLPLIIMFSVPLAAVGVAFIFALTRATVDIQAMIGGIMLVGIVVNNGIVMVDTANQLRDTGLDRVAAIHRAAVIRLRPVLMTALTTILAMVPLALEIGEGAEGWGGLAKSVIGGLTVATFLTLFVVPTMYTLLAGKQHRALGHES